MKTASTPTARLSLAFRAATSRPATMQEQKILLAAYHKILAKYQSDAPAALKLVTTGEAPRDEALNVAELAAYTSVMNLILNLDEVVTKE